MIFRRLQHLISMHSISSDTLSHLLLLITAFISLFTFSRERISWHLFWFSRHRFWALVFITSQTTHLSIYIFLRRLLWVLEKKRMNPSLEKGLKIVDKWIPFDSLVYVQESWRRPDLLERKESWSPQDVTIIYVYHNCSHTRTRTRTRTHARTHACTHTILIY